MSGNKFFFEEDSEAEQGSGVSLEEQADIFSDSVSQAGVSGKIDSMAPMKVEAAPVEVKQERTSLALVEFGVVDKNYAIHITPTHPQRNLKDHKKMRAAIEAAIIEMNRHVPPDLQVNIHLPQEDWDIKVLSFVVQGGAAAWNFDIAAFESEAVPVILKKVSDICAKL